MDACQIMSDGGLKGRVIDTWVEFQTGSSVNILVASQDLPLILFGVPFMQLRGFIVQRTGTV
jgi:hypothetical protein